MKFTLSWLKRHLDTDASLDQICDKLTSNGLEVESVEDRAKIYAPFKVAYVESAVQHPNADRLRVCMVKTETGVLQVVCGAPNARAGMKGIFAPEGSVIPHSGLVLKKGKIRDVESNGMLVSEEEMALPETIDGIIEVDQKYEIGTPIAEIYGLGDPVIEINLTPNRADCACVRGIARDLAAAGLGILKPLEPTSIKTRFKSPITVTINDTDGCAHFLGVYIKGVKNGPSPLWMQNYLKSIGKKSISALVDVTNFLTFDINRPLHVFDADKIKGNLLIRAAQENENFAALDENTYALQPHMTVIADDSGSVALGGIMGGDGTKCTNETVNVFLEAAYFNAARIARTGRDVNIQSDARYRFERGIDPDFTRTGIEIAAQLILEICGGEASAIVEAGTAPVSKRTIEYDYGFVKKLIGVDVREGRQREILNALGFEISDAKITVPTWRGDVEGKADITEEIIRIHGFDHIPALSVRNDRATPVPAETVNLSRALRARIALAARGMNECVTWSFMADKTARHFNDNNDMAALTLKNPISADLNVMRPTPLANLIAAAARNHDLGYPGAALFEVGPAFSSPKPDGQITVAAGVRAAPVNERNWADGNAARNPDAYDAKADAMAALAACGASIASVQIAREAPGYYHPGRSGALKLGPNVLAYFGEIHPAVLDDMGVKTPVAGFEVFPQKIPEARKKGSEKPMLKLEPLMPLSRDFAFLMDAGVEAEAIIKTVKYVDKNLITDANVFDIYAGKGIDPGKKSVAFQVTIQPREKSLTDAEIETLSKKIIDAVVQKTGGVLRG
jgi:phenylalanyl-tRNA synthetase beta chain